jgi:hypothetical protein
LPVLPFESRILTPVGQVLISTQLAGGPHLLDLIQFLAELVSRALGCIDRPFTRRGTLLE